MARLIERGFPTSVRGEACDPELAPVVADYAPGLIDEAPSITCEHPAFVDRMKISKGIYSIGPRGALGHRWE
jgi:hypothetical protein